MLARHWKKYNDKIQCTLCPHNCIIQNNHTGICSVRKNINNQLESLNYGRTVSINVDPIEKKPMYHFLPGTKSLSIGTVGCNLKCLHCQNWEISTAKPGSLKELDLPPEVIVQLAIDKGCQSISYTYNEPTIFHEYATDIAKIAREKGIKNIVVTNGFITKEAAQEFSEIMDGANIDLKAFNDEFYEKTCKASLKPVLEAISIYKKKLWVEITNLIIEGKNDSVNEIEKMCKWIKQEIGEDTPIHFSKAFPLHKMKNIKPTPEKTLLDAKNIAEKYLNYVYIGNTNIKDAQNTYCPACKKLIIQRENLNKNLKNIKHRCDCGEEIGGIWS